MRLVVGLGLRHAAGNAAAWHRFRRWILALGLFLACAPPIAAADPLAALIEEHGKPAIVEFVLERRFGEISVDRKGGIKSTYGRPNFDFITARSLASDASQLELDAAGFVESFLAWQAAKTAQVDARRASEARVPTGRAQAGGSRSSSAPVPGTDIPMTSDGLGVPESSPPIQFLTPAEMEAQDPSYACMRQCERKNVQCTNAKPGDVPTEMACAEKYHACVDRC